MPSSRSSFASIGARPRRPDPSRAQRLPDRRQPRNLQRGRLCQPGRREPRRPAGGRLRRRQDHRWRRGGAPEPDRGAAPDRRHRGGARAQRSPFARRRAPPFGPPIARCSRRARATSCSRFPTWASWPRAPLAGASPELAAKIPDKVEAVLADLPHSRIGAGIVRARQILGEAAMAAARRSSSWARSSSLAVSSCTPTAASALIRPVSA